MFYGLCHGRYLPCPPFPFLAGEAPLPPHDFKTNEPLILFQRILIFPAFPPFPKEKYKN